MIGTETPDIVVAILKANPRIQSINVFDYEHPLLLQERIQLTSEERLQIEEARATRARTGIPFWEALLLSCFNSPFGYERILREALFHQSHRSALVPLSRQAVESGQLHRLARTAVAGARSLSSIVQVNGGEEMHLLLMDFHCPESPLNDRLVTNACRLLFSGTVFILASGESYHAIGARIVEWSELQEVLGRSLLLAPIVDTRYVGHQLIERACGLRFSTAASKAQRPTVKTILEA